MQKQNSLIKSAFFTTQDISFCAAALTTKRVQLIDSQRITPYRFEFYLHPVEVCEELQRDYINGSLLVSAREISDNVRFLKSLIKDT